MSAIVLQVNTSSGGVPKRAIDEATFTRDGLAGDAWKHPHIHGGPRQAALLITIEGIEELTALGFPLYPGALGENITSRGLDRRTIRFGQRYRVGSAVLEVTKMRVPCATLNPYGKGIQAAMYDSATRQGDATSVKWGLSGFYAAVVEPGTAHAGDVIELLT
jgi:MOSC domain-containing protein YiiM